MRYGLRGKGKRGGMRVIHYWVLRDETILLLYAYAKNAQEDLTESQKKTLRRLIKE
ncbi:MAG: type II toxin-antitoxin system RelE/ParE family toxin [Desulfovibrio sp.]|nr:type II toxin-antitoxin system RelE/ParE family toxin [Desulfovibrio sp.]